MFQSNNLLDFFFQAVSKYFKPRQSVKELNLLQSSLDATIQTITICLYFWKKSLVRTKAAFHLSKTGILWNNMHYNNKCVLLEYI